MRELPADPLMSGGSLDKAGGSPMTALQALMEADRFDDPLLSVEERQPLVERVWDALDLLDEEDRLVVIDLYVNGLSLQKVAKATGRSLSTIRRVKDRSLGILREALSDLHEGASE